MKLSGIKEAYKDLFIEKVRQKIEMQVEDGVSGFMHQLKEVHNEQFKKQTELENLIRKEANSDTQSSGGM